MDSSLARPLPAGAASFFQAAGLVSAIAAVVATVRTADWAGMSVVLGASVLLVAVGVFLLVAAPSRLQSWGAQGAAVVWGGAVVWAAAHAGGQSLWLYAHVVALLVASGLVSVAAVSVVQVVASFGALLALHAAGTALAPDHAYALPLQVLIALYLAGAAGVTTVHLAARRRSERDRRRMRAWLDRIPDAVYATDAQGEVVFANRAGRHREVDAWLAAGSDDTSAPIPSDRDVLDRGVEAGGTQRVVDETGQRAVAWSKLPIAEAGQARGLLVVAQDVTELSLESERLELEKEEAERSSQAKSQLLANVSHEIRTPMNGILGMSSLLEETELTPEQREYVQTIGASSKVLLSVLSDVLDFSRLASGQVELVKAPFDVLACVEGVVRRAAPDAEARGLALGLTVGTLPQRVTADEPRLRQALINLVENAVAFTDEGGVHIDVSARPDGGTCELSFAVRDTGVGIDPGTLADLLDGHGPSADYDAAGAGGAGLGLPIAQRVARMMGGEVTATSRPGEGSTFTLTVRVPAGAETRALAPADALEGRRTLLVTANPVAAAVVDAYAARWRLEPACVLTFAEAADWLASHSADVVLVDGAMPNAPRFVAAMRRKHTGQAVLALRAGAQSDALGRAGASQILSGPLLSDPVFHALKALVGASSSSEPAGEAEEESALRVLLAEDNLVNRKVALRILSKVGLEADVAPNGAEALRQVQAQSAAGEPYDLILMDIQMPIMDGYEATQSIRSFVEPRHQPRIVAVTANVMPGDRELCLEAGMDDYLPKPLTADALRGALAETAPLARSAATVTA